MGAKQQLLLLVLALVLMAILSVFSGHLDSAILCAAMAVIGSMIAAFGFRKGFRCICANCGESIFVPKKSKEEVDSLLCAAGWCRNGDDEYCKTCATGITDVIVYPKP